MTTGLSSSCRFRSNAIRLSSVSCGIAVPDGTTLNNDTISLSILQTFSSANISPPRPSTNQSIKRERSREIKRSKTNRPPRPFPIARRLLPSFAERGLWDFQSRRGLLLWHVEVVCEFDELISTLRKSDDAVDRFHLKCVRGLQSLDLFPLRRLLTVWHLGKLLGATITPTSAPSLCFVRWAAGCHRIAKVS